MVLSCEGGKCEIQDARLRVLAIDGTDCVDGADRPVADACSKSSPVLGRRGGGVALWRSDSGFPRLRRKQVRDLLI